MPQPTIKFRAHEPIEAVAFRAIAVGGCTACRAHLREPGGMERSLYKLWEFVWLHRAQADAQIRFSIASRMILMPAPL